MLARLAWLALTVTAASAVVFDAGTAGFVTAENPTAPCLQAGASGGLDADYPGDDAALMISAGAAGKKYYGTPDSVSLTVETSTPGTGLVVRVGYRAYRYGTPKLEARWDGALVATIDTHTADEPGVLRDQAITLTADQAKPGRHRLKLTEASGADGLYGVVDAVAFDGDPGLWLVTPRGRKVRPRPAPPTAERPDPNLDFYRETAGAAVPGLIGPTGLAPGWAVAGSGGGVVGFQDGTVLVPTPPALAHNLANPTRSTAGTFYLVHPGPFPAHGVIDLRLRAVDTGDRAVQLVGFHQADGKVLAVIRFNDQLALSDGRFVKPLASADNEFHDLRVVYGEGKAQVTCDGRTALADEPWPPFVRLTVGHALPWQGYGVGVAVQRLSVMADPSRPLRLKVIQAEQPLTDQPVVVRLGDRETTVSTDRNGLVEVPLGDGTLPRPLTLTTSGRTFTTSAWPGDTWVANLSGLPRPPGPAGFTAQADPGEARGEWWLDFGEDGSEVAEGFLPVGPESLAAGHGYGWLGSYYLTPATQPLAKDPLAGDLLDLGDTHKPVGFDLATPPGRYVVSLLLGGEDLTPDFTVFANGAPAAIVREPHTGTSDVVSFPVATAKGGVTLGFDVRQSLALAGLTVTPADPASTGAARARTLAARLNRVLTVPRAVAQGLQPDPPTAEPEPPIANVDRARGFVAFAHTYMRTVYPSSRPRPADLGQPAVAFVAPGDREPLTLSVWPLRILPRARVVISELRGPRGVLPASAVSVRSVTVRPRWSGKNRFREVPQLLEPLGPDGVDLRPGETHTFWLTVSCPSDAAPGDYRGQAVITSDAGGVALPVWVKVLPLRRVATDDLTLGMYWGFGMSAHGDWDLARKQFADMREHGCNSVTLDEPVSIQATPDGPRFDFTTLDRLLTMAKAAGLTGPVPYFGIPSRLDRATYRQLVAALVTERQRRGWPELLFYPVDEPGNDPKQLALAEELCKLIKTVPGARTYVTVNGQGVDAARLSPWLDVRCYQHLSYNPEEARKTREARETCWFYTGPLGSIADTRLNEGLWWYRSEMTGHFYWHYCNPIGDPWYDFDGPGDYIAAFVGDDGPIDTIEWEGVREGLDDLRTFRTLEARATQAKAAGLAAGDEALAWLTRLKERIPADGKELVKARSAVPAEEWVAIRWEATGRILALEAALRRSPAPQADAEFERALLGPAR